MLALLAAQPATANSAPDSAPTTAANADGSSTLTTGTYFACVTETNGFGETTASPVSTPGVSITSGTNHLTVTPPSRKTGNTASNIYISAVSNAGPWQLAAVGVTGATNIAAPITNSWSSVQPPTVNTTALSAKQIELIRTIANGDVRRLIQHLDDVLRNFLRGAPMPYSSVIKHWEEADAAVHLLDTLMSEIGTLIVANPGTIAAGSIVGNLYPPMKRTWP